MSDGIDPDGAPELTEDMAAIAEVRVGGRVVRPASGYLGPEGVVRGCPPLRE
ncbi:hypothetical protein [uncultured Sphingomonas sp.]|uniref:hypothetical protein n=1 Tax=uncultured Sphingomonas sp. TaxID=158754 RepID=UPI0025EA3E70|nr:hypothetical protein [uncultured Sphingomonas sp.]